MIGDTEDHNDYNGYRYINKPQVLFKECLRYDIVPFIISDALKTFYYRGLSEWDDLKGYLMDTCLTAQDRFKKVLEYYRIENTNK